MCGYIKFASKSPPLPRSLYTFPNNRCSVLSCWATINGSWKLCLKVFLFAVKPQTQRERSRHNFVEGRGRRSAGQEVFHGSGGNCFATNLFSHKFLSKELKTLSVCNWRPRKESISGYWAATHVSWKREKGKYFILKVLPNILPSKRSWVCLHSMCVCRELSEHYTTPLLQFQCHVTLCDPHWLAKLWSFSSSLSLRTLLSESFWLPNDKISSFYSLFKILDTTNSTTLLAEMGTCRYCKFFCSEKYCFCIFF